MQFAFEDFELDTGRFELRRAGQHIALEPQVFEVLAFLVERHDRAVTRDELIEHVWPERYISDAALSSRLMAARKAIGDTGRDQRLIRTIHGRGFRFVGEVRELATASVAGGEAPGAANGLPQTDLPLEDSPEIPVIRYAAASDGASIAYSVTGQGPPVVRSLGWFTHLEREFEWETGRRFWQRFARNHTLIRYDGRGMGLSDPVDEFTAETRVSDLEAVINAAGLDRFALLGMSEGTYTALHYAARFPERVTHLICYGFGPTVDEAERKAWHDQWRMLIPVVRNGWGRDLPIYRKLFAELFLGPDADPEDIRYFVEMQRASTTPDRAAEYLQSIVEKGVKASARSIRVPTLLLHRRGDPIIPFSRGRRLASLIPGAQFVPLEGANHWLLYDDPGAPVFVRAVEEFLRS